MRAPLRRAALAVVLALGVGGVAGQALAHGSVGLAESTFAHLTPRQAAVVRASTPSDHRAELAEAWADPSGAFQGFDVHPSVVIGIAALALLYALAVGPLRQRIAPGARLKRRHVFWYTTSLVLLFVTLDGPLHHLSDFYLFTAHMVQHLLLGMLFPVLFLAGLPGWLFSGILRRPAILRFGRAITRPLVAFLIYNACLVGWHIPAAYQATLYHHDIHIFEHLLFMATGVIGWWPVAGCAPELPRLRYLWQIGYLFAMQLPMIAIGICLTLADHVIYPFYAAAPRVIAGFTPLMDQRVGGLVMWLPGHLVLWIPMALIFFRWYRAQEDDATGLGAPVSPSPAR